MGQKIHPRLYRLGVGRTLNTSHVAVWYANHRQFKTYLQQDLLIRRHIESRCHEAGVAEVEIKRPSQSSITVYLHCSRPARIIGKKGAERDLLVAELTQMVGMPCHVTIVEFKKPETSAKLLAESIASQLSKRIAFRKAMKRAMQTAMRAGAEGVKVRVSGRLAGAEIARSEWYKEGRIPLHTLRADIDYGVARSQTTYGIIGVKVWVYHGDSILNEESDTDSK